MPGHKTHPPKTQAHWLSWPSLVPLDGFAEAEGAPTEARGDEGSPLALPQFVPHPAFWGLTRGCILRCVQCHAAAQEPAWPFDLPTPEALSVIEQVPRYNQPKLLLSGGDPPFRTNSAAIPDLGRWEESPL